MRGYHQQWGMFWIQTRGHPTRKSLPTASENRRILVLEGSYKLKRLKRLESNFGLSNILSILIIYLLLLLFALRLRHKRISSSFPSWEATSFWFPPD